MPTTTLTLTPKQSLPSESALSAIEAVLNATHRAASVEAHYAADTHSVYVRA